MNVWRFCGLYHPAAQAVPLYDKGFSLRAFISLDAHCACSLCVLQPAALLASLQLLAATGCSSRCCNLCCSCALSLS